MSLVLTKWAPSSEFVSSSIPSWQISTAHAQPFRGGTDLVFCLKVPLNSLLVWASSEGFGETARMRRLAWTFAARIGDKYQIRLTRSKCVFGSLRPGKTQIDLLSYRDQLEFWNFGYTNWRYHSVFGSEQQRRSTDCADAQADLRLCWSHMV